MTIKASRQNRKGTVLQRDYHRRSPEGLQRVRSAFRIVVGQRGPIPFVPRAGPLERNLQDRSSRDEEINPGSQTLCVSLSTLQNAITSSSGSPAGGLPQPHRNLPATTHIQLPSRSSKTLKENGFQSLCSIPRISKKTRYEKVAEITPRQVKSSRSCIGTTPRGRSRQRKDSLLPRRRKHLTLPPPLKLGYRVGAEHLDQEKETAFCRLNLALRGECLISQDSSTTQSFCSPSLPASGTVPPPAVPTVLSKQAGKRKCIVEQDSLGPGALQAPAVVTSSLHPGSGRKRSTSAACPSSSEALPGSSSHSTATASDLSLAAVGKDGIRRKSPSVPGPSAREAPAHRKGKRKSSWEAPLHGEDPAPLGPRASERAAVGAGSAFPAIPKTSKVESLPAVCASSLASSQSHCPAADSGVPFLSSLPNTAPAQGNSLSASTSVGLCTLPVTGLWLSPLDSTSRPQPLLPKPAASCRGSSFPPAQVIVTPSSGSTDSARDASVLPGLRLLPMAPHEKYPTESASSNGLMVGANDRQQHGDTHSPSRLHLGDLKTVSLGMAPPSTPGQPVLGSMTQAALGGSLHTNMTSGTGASNQLVSTLTQGLISAGTSIASASATAMGKNGSTQPVSTLTQGLNSAATAKASDTTMGIRGNSQPVSTLTQGLLSAGTSITSASATTMGIHGSTQPVSSFTQGLLSAGTPIVSDTPMEIHDGTQPVSTLSQGLISAGTSIASASDTPMEIHDSTQPVSTLSQGLISARASITSDTTMGIHGSSQQVSSLTQSLFSTGTSIASASDITLGIHGNTQQVSTLTQHLISAGTSIASATPMEIHDGTQPVSTLTQGLNSAAIAKASDTTMGIHGNTQPVSTLTQGLLSAGTSISSDTTVGIHGNPQPVSTLTQGLISAVTSITCASATPMEIHDGTQPVSTLTQGLLSAGTSITSSSDPTMGTHDGTQLISSLTQGLMSAGTSIASATTMGTHNSTQPVPSVTQGLISAATSIAPASYTTMGTHDTTQPISALTQGRFSAATSIASASATTMGTHEGTEPVSSLTQGLLSPGISIASNSPTTMRTPDSTQLVCSVTQSLSSPGTSTASANTSRVHDLIQLVSNVIQCLSSSGISIASASALASHMPSTMTRIQENRQLQSTLAKRSPDTGTLAVSAIPKDSKREELPPDFIRLFEALTISSPENGTSSTTNYHGGSVVLSTGGLPSHSNPLATLGPSATKNSVHGAHRAPLLSPISTIPLKQKRSNSSGEPSDVISKAASKCQPKPASKFGIRAAHEAKVRRKLVFKATSSSAQASGLTTPAAATKSSSGSSEPAIDSKCPKRP